MMEKSDERCRVEDRMNPYRSAGEIREVDLRKQGIKALLRSATTYLENNPKRCGDPADSFLIHLFWAANASLDGKTFDIRPYPPEEKPNERR